MVPRFSTLALAFVLAGCAGSAAVAPEAEPFVARAGQSPSGLSDYLEASGIGHQVFRIVSEEPEPGVTSRGSVRFDRGGACLILVYENDAAAAQLGPRSGGGEVYARRSENFGGATQSTTQQRYKPTYRFGRLVAVCSSEPPDAAQALLALQTVAEPRGAARTEGDS